MMTYGIVLLLFVIAVELEQIRETMMRAHPKAEWIKGKWNGVKDV